MGNCNIKDLYHKENFYKAYDENTQYINTMLKYIDPPKVIDIKDYIYNIIKPIEKLLKITDDLKNKLLNIEVVNIDNDSHSDSDNDSHCDCDETNENTNTFEKDGYDFSGEKLKLSNKYINEKMKKDLFVILFRYIVNNVDDDVIKNMNGMKESNESKKGWWW